MFVDINGGFRVNGGEGCPRKDKIVTFTENICILG